MQKRRTGRGDMGRYRRYGKVGGAKGSSEAYTRAGHCGRRGLGLAMHKGEGLRARVGRAVR